MSSASQPTETIKSARSALVENYEFYRGLDVQITLAQIECICGTCNGEGQIRKGVRIIKMVCCPTCRGKDSRQVVETWIDLPKTVWL